MEYSVNNSKNNATKVLKSIKGFNVKQKEYDKKIYLQYICDKEDRLLSELLAVRGVRSKDKENYLEPKLKNLLPEIGVLKDTNNAVERILKAIKNKEKICIFGDYDVDGITSTSMFYLFLEQFGIVVDYYIPDRIKEGYGPNINAFQKIKDDKVDLVICVDCGATAYEQVDFAKKIGLDVIIIDHHKTDNKLPDCIACVNPNRFDEDNLDEELHCLCACGVSFLVLIALASELKKQNISIDLMRFTPLVAFATICDVMKLTKLNRAFVKTGISVLKKNQEFNLFKLIEITETERQKENMNNNSIILNAYTFGFLLGPMVNAGGRIGNSSLGFQLLTEKDNQKATLIAKQLYDLNEERKTIENEALDELIYKKDEIKQQIKEQGFIILYSKDWHEGVVGLIASRIKEQYCYPVFIGSITYGNTVKFSSRSVEGVDIGAIIIEAIDKKILLNGGGHKMAGGMTCDVNNIEILKTFLKAKIKINADKSFKNKEILYDLKLSLGGLSFELLETISKFEPFGTGNEKPIFLIQDALVLQVNVIKDKHISLVLKDTNNVEKAICFNCINYEIGKFLLSSTGKKITFLASSTFDQWNGKVRKNIIIEDVII